MKKFNKAVSSQDRSKEWAVIFSTIRVGKWAQSAFTVLTLTRI